jgi:hypothetical protein
MLRRPSFINFLGYLLASTPMVCTLADSSAHQLTPPADEALVDDSHSNENLVIKLRNKLADLELKKRALQDFRNSLDRGLKADPKASTVNAKVTGSSAIMGLLMFRKKPTKDVRSSTIYSFDGSVKPRPFDDLTPLTSEDYDAFRKSYTDFLTNQEGRPKTLSITVGGTRHTFQDPSELVDFIQKRTTTKMNGFERQRYIVEEHYLNSMAADYKAKRLETSAALALKSRQEYRHNEETAQKLKRRKLRANVAVGVGAAASIAFAGMMWVNSDNSVEIKAERPQAQQLAVDLEQVQKDIESAQGELQSALSESTRTSALDKSKPGSKIE